jgi:hypothetical protein
LEAAASPAVRERHRWDVVVFGLLGSLVLFGATNDPWLTSATYSSEPVKTPPVSLTAFDFGFWGYVHVLGTGGLAVLTITALVRRELLGRALPLLSVAAGALGLVGLLVVTWQIHRYEIVARTRWSDVLWAVQQRDGAFDLKFYRTGLTTGIVALYLLVVSALLACSPRKRSPKILAVASSFGLLLWIPLPWRVEWITDSAALEYRYQPVLSIGPPARLLAAITATLAILLLVGARAAGARRWVLPWLTGVVVLVVGSLGAMVATVGAIPSGREGLDRQVDVEFTAIEGPVTLAGVVLFLMPVVAVKIARSWTRATMEHELRPSTEATPRPLTWSRWRILVAVGMAVVVLGTLSSSLKNDEATQTAEMCTDITSSLQQTLIKMRKPLAGRPQDSVRIAGEAADELRSAAAKTGNDDIIRAVAAAADELELVATGKRPDPRVSEYLSSIVGDVCGRPTAR